MKKTFTITLILLGCMTAMGQTKTDTAFKLSPGVTTFGLLDSATMGSLRANTSATLSNSNLYLGDINKPDTVMAITYCLNLKTLKPKSIRLKAVAGRNNSAVNFNGLIIYNKYLNVPKGYKAIYSISK